MNINPNYTSEENTPLRFFAFVKVTLAIQMVMRLVRLVKACSSGFQADLFCRTLLALVITLFAINGFNRMDWSGVRAYCGLFLLSALEHVVGIAIYAFGGLWEETAYLAGGLLRVGLWLVLVWIYFKKRRLLFSPVPEQWAAWVKDGSENDEPGTHEPLNYEEETYETEKPEELYRREPYEAAQYEPKQYETEHDDPKRSGVRETVPPWEGSASKRRAGKGLWLAVAAGFALVVGGFWLWRSGPQGMTPAQAAEQVLYLEVYNRSDMCIATGSGFLIEDGQTLVTNYHVVEGADYVLALTGDWETEIRIDTVLAWDKDCDLAILRCGEKLGEALSLADSDQVKQGDAIYAAGYPLGIANTLSDGIVSSRYVDEYGVELLQITAPISGGSSGGALLNQKGQVIGVTSASYESGQNLNLAISSNEIARVLAEETEPRLLTEMIESPLSTPTVGVPNTTGNGINYELCFVEIGNTVTLTMMVDGKEVPQEEVVWSSSDPKRMPVQSGVVWVDDITHVFEEITAITKDGHRGSCKVYGKRPSPVHPEGGILVYDDVPWLPSMEQVFGEEPIIGLWKYFNATGATAADATYSYMTPSRVEAEYYIRKYGELLQACGFEEDDRGSGLSRNYDDPTGTYRIWISAGESYTGEEEDVEPYPIVIRIMKWK